MSKDTITLVLSGEINIQKFVKAVTNLEDLIKGITKELNIDNSVKWLIHDLDISSAIITTRGESDIISKVESVVNVYGEIGKSLQNKSPINYSERVTRPANNLLALIDKDVTSIKFETPDTDAIVFNSSMIIGNGTIKSFGAMEGRIQTLSNRKGLRFTLYDTLNDKAISCYLEEGQDDLIRNAWGKRAFVQGEISREILTGRALTIRHITLINILSEGEKGSYLKARGIIPIKDESLRPELVIRQLRNVN